MTRALLTAASGMKAQQMKVDSIANNIANANTAGYKKSGLSFRSLLYQTFREPGAPTGGGRVNPSGLQIGSGTEVADSFKNHSQGILEPTGAPYDLAIEGPGYFEVTLPNGDLRYTRDGSFRIDGQGTIVSPQGYPLVGAPTIPPDAIQVNVSPDGIVSWIISQGAQPTGNAQISLTRFANSAGLKAQGGNLFSATVSSGTAQLQIPGQTGTGMIRQGYRERSNVQVVDELVELIVAQRTYEVNSRAIRTSDEMLQQLNQLSR